MKRLVYVLLALAAFSVPALSPPTHWISPNLFGGTVLEATYQPSAIKSIQQNILAVGVGNLTATQAITAVTVASSAVIGRPLSSNVQSGTLGGGDLCRVVMTSSTLLTATRDALTGSGSLDAGCSIAWTVIEFVPQFIKQRFAGVTAVAGSSTTGIGGTVVVAKSACFWGGESSTSTAFPGPALGFCYVNATTTIALGQIANSDTPSQAWTVLEFK